jgi:hypothetical protein
MFLRAEYGHFYKWLTSIGLVLIAASVALPWFVHQAADALTIPGAELATYTETARRVLESRQADLEFVQSLLPWLVVFVLTLGIGVSYFGLIGWKQRQDKVDQSEDIDLAKKQLEIEQLTEHESDEKRQAEVLEEVASIADGDTEPAQAPSGVSPVSARMEELKILEEQTSDLLTQAFGSTHQVVARVGIKTAAGIRIRVDAVAQDSDGLWSAVVQDTIRVSSSQLVRNQIRQALQRLAYASYDIAPGVLALADSTVDVKATGLLLVVPEIDVAGSVRRVIEEELQQMNLVLKRPVALLVVERNAIDSMATRTYRDLIVKSLRTPAVVTFA